MIGRLLRLHDLLPDEQERSRGPQGAAFAVGDDLVLPGLERQVEHREREHRFEEAAAGLEHRGRDEGLPRPRRGVVGPEVVGLDDVGRRLLHLAVPVRVLREHLGRIHGAEQPRDRVALARLFGELAAFEVVEGLAPPRSFAASGFFSASAASSFSCRRASLRRGLPAASSSPGGGADAGLESARRANASMVCWTSRSLPASAYRNRRSARSVATGLISSPSRTKRAVAACCAGSRRCASRIFSIRLSCAKLHVSR